MLFKNDIFAFEGETFRLLHTDTERNSAWAIDTVAEVAWPVEFKWSSIVELDITLPDGPPRSITPSFSMRLKRDLSLQRIRPLIDQVPGIFCPQTRGRLIKQRALELGCSDRTLHKDLRRWFQRGQTPDALLADYDNSGRHDTSGTAKRGKVAWADASKTAKKYEVYQLSEEDITNIDEHIKNGYLKDLRITKTAAYLRLLEKHFVNSDGNGKVYINDAGNRPTLKQFIYFLNKNFPLEAQLRGRKGDKDFELQDRAKLSTVGADCRGVGHYYEIDATIADVFLVLTADSNEIIGKPTLYLIIDRKSRLIVGYYCGLENASWVGATQAILSIVEDKRKLCERYGVPYTPEDWPAHGLFPRELLGDCSEMKSRASNYVAEGLAITLTNTPAKRGDYKGLVECSFKLTQEDIKDVVPGYDPPANATKRQGKKYYKDACLTLSEFNAIVINAIIAHNRKAMPDYDLDISEITKGILPTPLELWNNDIQKSASNLTRYTELQVRHALLERDVATVTEFGILFKGCYYTCPEAQENSWFVTARHRGVFKVNVSFDRRRVNSILIHSLKDGKTLIDATLTRRSLKFEGMAFAEVQYCEKLAAKQEEAIKQNRLQTMHEFHEKTDPLVSGAQKRYAKQRVTGSRSSRRADTKDSRMSELQIERDEIVNVSAAGTKPAPKSNPDNVVSLPVKHSSINLTKITTQHGAGAASLTPAQRAQEIRKKMLNGY